MLPVSDLERHDLPERLDGLEGLVGDEIGLLLARYAAAVPAGRAIVELGSYKGQSTCWLAAGAVAGLGAHVWAVDAWDLAGNPTGRHRFADALPAFLNQLERAGYRGDVTPVQAFSADAGDAWAGPPVGLLYVDADHSRQAVWADFWAWWPHLEPGSVVAFDDYGTARNPGVAQAVDRLARRGHLADVTVEAGRLAVGRATALGREP